MKLIKFLTISLSLIICSAAFGQWNGWTGKYQLAWDENDPNVFYVEIVPDMDGKIDLLRTSNVAVFTDPSITYEVTDVMGNWSEQVFYYDENGLNNCASGGDVHNISMVSGDVFNYQTYKDVPFRVLKFKAVAGDFECATGDHGARFYGVYWNQEAGTDPCYSLFGPFLDPGIVINDKDLNIPGHTRALTGFLKGAPGDPLTCDDDTDVSDCALPVEGEDFGWYVSNSGDSTLDHSFTQPGTNAGFVLDIHYLDNSFNMIINGSPIATNELEFQSDSIPGINVEFDDNTQYQSTTELTIWRMNQSYVNPVDNILARPVVLRVIISPAGEVSMFGWKGSSSDLTLYPLRLKTGVPNAATFNTVNWNKTGINEITVSQNVETVTSMYGTGYGLNYAPCDCVKPSIATGPTLNTEVGVSALDRDGFDRAEDNWPQLRKGAWIALESHTKGFVPNRVSNADRANIIPVAGMMIYNTDEDCLQINVNGTATGWHCFNEPGCPDVIVLPKDQD